MRAIMLFGKALSIGFFLGKEKLEVFVVFVSEA